jgi:exopolyphosphatase/guanosine-5'-triphosphate,3'-diphosphate pyrophosphatase
MSKFSFKFITYAALIASLFGVGAYYAKGVQKNKDVVVRAAIDIGSGATKLKVAEIDLKNQKIKNILVNESFSVQYQDELEKSPDNNFSEKLMEEGISALKESKKIALKHGADKVVAVATASFRVANNAKEFIDRIDRETGVKVHIVDQDLEGALGFEATKAQVEGNAEDIIVWDIGGGSYQFSMLDEKGELIVHRGLDASIPFKNRVIKHIKLENPQTVGSPNPLNIDQIKIAETHAVELSKKVDNVFKEKINNPSTKVIGIGNIFSYRIHPLVEKKSKFHINDLSEKVYYLDGLHDKDLNLGEYSNVAVTNPILVLGFMNQLGIDEMHVMDINNADGALLYGPFWEKDEIMLA